MAEGLPESTYESALGLTVIIPPTRPGVLVEVGPAVAVRVRDGVAVFVCGGRVRVGVFVLVNAGACVPVDVGVLEAVGACVEAWVFVIVAAGG